MEFSGFCVSRGMGNHLRAAWRHISRAKGFVLLTVLGLAPGLAACLFIGLFVVDEWKYDRYNVNADRIFRIAADLRINGGNINDVATPVSMAAALKKDYPAIENAVRIRSIPRELSVHIGEKVFSQAGGVFVDSTLFAVFTLPMVEGDPRTALSAPNSVVLSASTATKYFNTTDVTGRTLRLDEDTAVYRITGVIQDMPAQSHFHFQLIRLLQQRREEWVNLFGATYVLVRPGIGKADIDRMLEQTVERYVYQQVREKLHNSPADLRRNGDHFRYYSMPLTRIHLHSNLGGEFEANGDIRYVMLFITVAVLTLAVACINFINLSIAGSMRRLREIGMRKVLGSDRRRLIIQFLLESVLMTGLAMAMALVLVVLLLPVFNQVAGKTFTVLNVLSGWTIPACLLTTGLVGLLSGAYPALLLSRAEPLKILRGQLTMGTRIGTWRSALLVFQFTIAMILMISTGVIYSQLSYIQHRDIGYTRQQVVTIKDTRAMGDQAWTFAGEARRLPGVVDATVSGFLPNQKVVPRGFFKDRSASVTSTVLLGDWLIDASYLSTLDMKVVAGRAFSPELPTDSGCVLINETAARVLGYARPVGERIYTAADTVSGLRIIGVVKDFQTGSFRDPVDPLVLRLGREGAAVSFRLSAGNIAGTLRAIRERYEKAANGHAFVYSFLDDDFDRLYAADRRTASLFTLFSLLAILIAGLGIFGLVTAAAEQRTKELGIRRVLGARVSDLAGLLMKDYGAAIVLAVLVAVPTGAWLMHSWLQGFVYRTGLQPWIFIAAPLGIIAVAAVIVGVKAGRAGAVRLTETLRVE